MIQSQKIMKKLASFLFLCLVFQLSRDGIAQERSFQKSVVTPQTAKVSKSIINDIVKALVRDKELDQSCIAEEKDKTKIVNVKPAHLSNSSSNEYLVEGNSTCAFGARSPLYWIYSEVNGKYKLLLSAGANDDLKIGQTRTNGLKDIIGIYTYNGGTKSGKVIFKFNGNIYTQQKAQ